jgi:hypothetical protein
VQTALVEAVSAEVEPILQRYRQGDELVLPMHTCLAPAHRPGEDARG